MKSWYIVHVLSGAEEKAKANLESRIQAFSMQDYIEKIIIPREQVTEVSKTGKKRVVKRKIFPGYLLIYMEMNDNTMNFVTQTPGITSFIGAKRKPVVVPDDEVDKILKREMETESRPLPKVSFHKGENVRVIEGPFINFNGVVEEINSEKGKLKVNVTIFGRNTPVELDFWQVEKI